MSRLKTWLGRTTCALLTLAVAPAFAWPDRPIELVVPYPAGGATDVIARMVAEKLPTYLHQPVVVRNQPGAGTTLAASQFARANPDGYKLYMTTAAHTISASLYKKLNYDPIKDFEPISLTATIPLVLVATNSLPVTDLKSLIDYAKKSPDGLTMASSGNGTPQHLTGELFKAKTDIPLTHIPYRGDTPMLTDLLGGQVQVAFVTLSAAQPHILAGKLRAIALAHPTRVASIKDVPTMEEAGLPGFRSATWFGIFAPAGLEPAVKEALQSSIQKVVAIPDLANKLRDMGAEVNNSSPEAFTAFIDEELKNWAEGVRLSGASVD